ncbi:MAG: hypothetical protein Q4G51_11810 [Dermatophilus congolensis]|nr:hypothetical protein [Dermatophilus congolensis]
MLASIAGSLMTGLVQHARVLPEWLDERRELALFGSSVTAPWSTPEIAGVGMILDYLEPDPEVVWTSERVEAALHDLRSAIAGPPGTSVEFGSDGGSR